MRKIIFNFLYAIGAAHLLYLTNKLNGKMPILLFHRVSPDPDPCWPPLTPSQFEETILLLSKHYTFSSLDQLLNTNKPVPNNACAIVFDDGFYDFKVYAMPVLAKYKIPVTLFVPTCHIEHNSPIWTSRLDNIILSTSKKNDNTTITVGRENITLDLLTEKGLFNTSTAIKTILLYQEVKTRNRIIKELQEQLADINIPNHPMLSWDDLKEMRSKHPTLSIQSHTHTHPFLPSLQKEDIETELALSKSILEEKRFSQVDKLAYPIGGCDTHVIATTKKHYSQAFKVGNLLFSRTMLKNNHEYRFQIPRINIHTSNPKETFFFINGFHSGIRLFFYK